MPKKPTEQKKVNQEWQKTFASNIGKIGILVQPPPKVDLGLRKPYRYITTRENMRQFIAAAKAVLKEYKDPILQCNMLEVKKLARGVRLTFFLLGYKPGLCGDPAEGITKKQWDDCCYRIQGALHKLVAPIPMYIAPWSATAKFQSRFDAYVAYSDL